MGTLERIMAKLSHTGESVIHTSLFVPNIQTWLRKTLICLCGSGLETINKLSHKLACFLTDEITILAISGKLRMLTLLDLNKPAEDFSGNPSSLLV